MHGLKHSKTHVTNLRNVPFRPAAMLLLHLLDEKNWFLLISNHSISSGTWYCAVVLFSTFQPKCTPCWNTYTRRNNPICKIHLQSSFHRPSGSGRSRCWCWRRSSQGLVGVSCWFGWLDLHMDFCNDKLWNPRDLWLFDQGGRIAISLGNWSLFLLKGVTRVTSEKTKRPAVVWPIPAIPQV